MPVIHYRINTPLDELPKKKIMLDTVRLVADIMQKPVSDIMVIYSSDDLLMGNDFSPAAFVDFKCVSGLTVAVSRKICNGVYHLLNEATGIEPARIYINFFEVSHAHAWRFVNGNPVCPKDVL